MSRTETTAPGTRGRATMIRTPPDVIVDRATRQGLVEGHTIETPFTIAAEAIVFREHFGHGVPNGQLPIFAVTYELPLRQMGRSAGCQAVLARATASTSVR